MKCSDSVEGCFLHMSVFQMLDGYGLTAMITPVKTSSTILLAVT